jgi:hypothetical protein
MGLTPTASIRTYQYILWTTVCIIICRAHCHTQPSALPHTATHCCTRLHTAACTAAHCRTAGQPHTAVRTAIHYQARCRTLPRASLCAHYTVRTATHCCTHRPYAPLAPPREFFAFIQLHINSYKECIFIIHINSCMNPYESKQFQINTFTWTHVQIQVQLLRFM